MLNEHHCRSHKLLLVNQFHRATTLASKTSKGQRGAPSLDTCDVILGYFSMGGCRGTTLALGLVFPSYLITPPQQPGLTGSISFHKYQPFPDFIAKPKIYKSNLLKQTLEQIQLITPSTKPPGPWDVSSDDSGCGCPGCGTCAASGASGASGSLLGSGTVKGSKLHSLMRQRSCRPSWDGDGW